MAFINEKTSRERIELKSSIFAFIAFGVSLAIPTYLIFKPPCIDSAKGKLLNASSMKVINYDRELKILTVFANNRSGAREKTKFVCTENFDSYAKPSNKKSSLLKQVY
tara:strand:+ start:59 stop:382 length:324 start_codon:yes stop_codon:yes gene_type:complete